MKKLRQLNGSTTSMNSVKSEIDQLENIFSNQIFPSMKYTSKNNSNSRSDIHRIGSNASICSSFSRTTTKAKDLTNFVDEVSLLSSDSDFLESIFHEEIKLKLNLLKAYQVNLKKIEKKYSKNELWMSKIYNNFIIQMQQLDEQEKRQRKYLLEKCVLL